MLSPELDEATYPVYHNQLGSFSLYIKPVKRDGYGYYYEAVVNRLLSSREKKKRARNAQ
jgi:hypothetical protein